MKPDRYKPPAAMTWQELLAMEAELNPNGERFGDATPLTKTDVEPLVEAFAAKVREQLETYAPKIRVPPEIASIQQALEGFKAKHAEFETKHAEHSKEFQALNQRLSILEKRLQNEEDKQNPPGFAERMRRGALHGSEKRLTGIDGR